LCGELDTDLCTTRSCDESNVDPTQWKCIVDTVVCDSQNGVCETPACDAATGSCTSVPKNCDDGFDCTADSCDAVNGCQNIPNNGLCDTNDVCDVFTCEVGKGCVTVKKDCALEIAYNNCTNITCVAFSGCEQVPRQCNYNQTITDCSIVACENKEDKCTTRQAACNLLDTSVIIGASLTAAAIAGIIIAIIVFLVGCGGGVYAVSNAAGGAASAPVYNNPIYAASGNSRSNPLHTT
jgi:hypothetical protein